MLKDLAREQEQATGQVNISALSRETGFDRKDREELPRSSSDARHPHQTRQSGSLQTIYPQGTEELSPIESCPPLRRNSRTKILRRSNHPQRLPLLAARIPPSSSAGAFRASLESPRAAFFCRLPSLADRGRSTPEG